MTDAASLYFDADGMRPRFRHLTFHYFERAARTAHLHCSHLEHHGLLGLDCM